MSETKKIPTLTTWGLSKEDINALLVQKALNEMKRSANDNKEEKKEERRSDNVVINVKKEEIIANSIQIVSDIHLEFPNVYESMPKIKPKAPIIALLGDIGHPQEKTYSHLLEELSKNFQHVIVILFRVICKCIRSCFFIFIFKVFAGNHEYYTSEYHKVHASIQTICEGFKNVHFLQCNTIEFPDVLPNIRIAGCTLWPSIDKKLHSQAMEQVNDYTMIEIQKSKEEITATQSAPEESSYLYFAKK
ncbi:metallophosphoesterase-like protein [Reticulomyxa filosa]|uniref:Metallophosphoesterase-like protein n=1 Tax=Reticulomyxa filosa TaxID=46433 RepID=X6NNZ1_RETFI|nr:metallophosphoesterase-like protein [Reticulomyxa filosa]|eukprot:ETO27092.1 metallophosphoesterase-like protein [Reticulomyxa filosa]